MFRAKTVDEIYSEVSGCSLVITNDAALATALNARVDRPVVGHFAVTPRQIAAMSAVEILGEPLMNDIRLVSAISEDTGIEFRKVHGEVMNIREIRKHTADVRKHLGTRSARRIYDSFDSLPTKERVMAAFDPASSPLYNTRPGEIAVVGLDFFDDLDKHFIPDDFVDVDVFDRGSEYSIEEIREIGNDRQIAENAVDLIDASNCDDCAIVLSASSPIADSVRSALYKKGIPFVNRFEVRDLAQIRDYLQFATLSLSYETLRVRHVREIFANYNGFFDDNTDGFLLSRLDGSMMRRRAAELDDVMRSVRSMSFNELRDRICDKRARIQVGIVLDDLGIAGERITSDLVSRLNYAVDSMPDLHHNEEIPIEEKTGVLIADCTESICVDRPLVFFLNMDHDWDVSTAGKPYIDSELENERNAERLMAVLQQGERRLYFVNTTKKGKPARPAMAFDSIMGRPASGFKDVCSRLIGGRWAAAPQEVRSEMGEERLENVDRIVGTFSKSGFNCFFSCPRMFMFYKILPSEERKSTELGSLVHEFAQLYACYPDVVAEVGMDALVDMVSDRYSGLSDPLMKEVDKDRVSRAMRNVARYIDDRMPGSVPLDRPPEKGHVNRFFKMFGLEYWSSCSESSARSREHPLYGVFDAVSDGLVMDYKTGKACSGKEICRDMNLGKASSHPEFQPILYCALAKELMGGGDFEMFYALANDVESADEDYDIERSVRTVCLLDEDLNETVRRNETIRMMAETKLSAKFRPFAQGVLNAISDNMGGLGPEQWREDPDIIQAVLRAAGLNDNKTNRKDAAAAVGKVASCFLAGSVCDEERVEIPLDALNEFYDMARSMHDDAIRYACTRFPAKPRIKCSDCSYFSACTSDRPSLEDEGDERPQRVPEEDRRAFRGDAGGRRRPGDREDPHHRQTLCQHHQQAGREERGGSSPDLHEQRRGGDGAARQGGHVRIGREGALQGRPRQDLRRVLPVRRPGVRGGRQRVLRHQGEPFPLRAPGDQRHSQPGVLLQILRRVQQRPRRGLRRLRCGGLPVPWGRHGPAGQADVQGRDAPQGGMVRPGLGVCPVRGRGPPAGQAQGAQLPPEGQAEAHDEVRQDGQGRLRARFPVCGGALPGRRGPGVRREGRQEGHDALHPRHLLRVHQEEHIRQPPDVRPDRTLRVRAPVRQRGGQGEEQVQVRYDRRVPGH
jgi:hypothetical protein